MGGVIKVSFSVEDMICTAVKGSTVEEMKEAIRIVRSNIVELRIDTLKDYHNTLEEIKQLVNDLHKLGKKSIITLRESSEGGGYEGSSDVKLKILLKLTDANPDFIDIELRFPLLSNLMEKLKDKEIKVIVSYHDFSGTPRYDVLRGIIKEGLSHGVHIVKVVTLANEPSDNITTLNLCSEWKGKVISFCMGRRGLLSRILAPFFGAPFTYAYPKGKGPTAPGQISVDEVIEFWKKLGLI